MLVHILFWYFGVPALLPQAVADWLNSHGSEFILSCVAIGLVMSAMSVKTCAARYARSRRARSRPRALGLGYLQTMRRWSCRRRSASHCPAAEPDPAAGEEHQPGHGHRRDRADGGRAGDRERHLPHLRGLRCGDGDLPGAVVPHHGRGAALQRRYRPLGRADHVGHPERQLAAAVDRAISARAAGRAGRRWAWRPSAWSWRCLRRAAGAGAHQSVALLALAGDRRGAAGARPAAIDVHFWAYFFVPIVIGRPAGTTTMVVALVCYESAYLAEIIRAGIQALPSGQQEAGRALGHTCRPCAA